MVKEFLIDSNKGKYDTRDNSSSHLPHVSREEAGLDLLQQRKLPIVMSEVKRNKAN